MKWLHTVSNVDIQTDAWNEIFREVDPAEGTEWDESKVVLWNGLYDIVQMKYVW